MTVKEMKEMNTELVLNAYNEVKDEEQFKAMGKMQKTYMLAGKAGVSHITVSKVLKENEISL